MAWRYLAQQLPSRKWMGELPLTGPELTRSLSAPGRLTGTVPIELAHLVGPDGFPLLQEWGTAIWAEAGGQIRGGGIVASVDINGATLVLDCVGIAGYPQGQPWMGAAYAGINADPLSIVRKVWDHLQGYPDGNLGVAVDATTSPVRVGTAEQDVEFETAGGENVEFEAGPFRLTWAETDDLGKVIDDLAASTPFDYVEESDWAGDGETLTHRLRLGYPRIGGRRPDLRFEIGVNVTVTPPITLDEYASEVLLVGAGEGAKCVRGHQTTTTGRLRRVAVVADKAVTSSGRAQQVARAELAARVGHAAIDSLELIDHPNAPLGSLAPGDEIRITGRTGWADLDLWVRVLDITIRPETDTMTLKVVTA